MTLLALSSFLDKKLSLIDYNLLHHHQRCIQIYMLTIMLDLLPIGQLLNRRYYAIKLAPIFYFQDIMLVGMPT